MSVHDEAQRQKRLWLAQDITRYEVVWLLLEGDDEAPDRYRSVRVVNRSVLDTRCPNDRCPEKHLRDLRTIEQVFEMISVAAEQCDIVVQYHEALHYPTWIRADCARSSQPNFRIFLRGFSAD